MRKPSPLPLSHAALESFGASAVAPGRMVFSSISGSHLYGFPSKNSDIDLRGTYVAPLRSVVSLREPVETREVSSTIDGVLVESVFHEVAKYFRLLVKGNGYVIEQIGSPIGIVRSEEFVKLQRLAPRFMTRKTVLGHYSGFSASQLSLIRRHPHKEVKIILYAFRVLMTGINALRTRQIEANIVELNKTFHFDFIDHLVEMKSARENSPLGGGGHSVDWYIAKAEELRGTLEAEAATSELPPAPDPASIDELDDLLYALRVATDATEAQK